MSFFKDTINQINSSNYSVKMSMIKNQYEELVSSMFVWEESTTRYGIQATLLNSLLTDYYINNKKINIHKF